MQSQSLDPRSNGVAFPNNTAGPGVRSVHFAPSVEMPSRAGSQPSVLGRSRARNAPYAPPSTAPSARSWVYPYNQHQPTPLPASPTDQPDALPGPFHKQKGLHAILGDDDELDDTDNTQTNSLGIDFGHHQTEVPSSKNKGKKSIIGRVFRGVGTVFGKESSSGGRKVKRQATASYDTVPTLATYADSSSNSNSATYGGDAQGPSSTLGPGPRVPYTVPTPILEVPETEDQSGSPPPEVLRLSDNIPPLQSRARPPPTTITSNPSNHRPKSVSRKPVNAGAPSSRFVEPAMTTESATGHNNNIYNHPDLEDRTTVMIFDQNLSRVPTGVQTPPVISRHPSSTRTSVQPELGIGAGAGLPFQPLRPTSFAATQTHAAPGSVRDPVSVAPTRRTSIASPLAPRSRQLSLNRGVVGQATSASSIPDFPPGPYPPHPTSRAASTIFQLPPPVPLPLQTTTATNLELTSPISAHPLPTEDYLKMTLSPPSSKHTVTTSNTTFSSNPSFSSDLSPFVRFVKTLYKMPWISNDRVTVDYLPDHGLLGAKNVKGKKGKVKRTATWYRSMLASRRNSDNATTDLLGRGGRGGRRRQNDLDVSLGAALADFAATKHRKGRTERSRRHHHQRHHRHHHSSSRHQHHGRRTTTTTTTMTEDDSTIDSVLQTTTPLPHAMYPYFPPFPIAFQSPFPQNDHSPPGTAGLATHAGVQPNGAAAAYQPLFSPTPFYVFPQGAIPPPPGPTADKHAVQGGVADHNNNNMKTSNGSAIPPMLVPGGVDTDHIPGAFS